MKMFIIAIIIYPNLLYLPSKVYHNAACFQLKSKKVLYSGVLIVQRVSEGAKFRLEKS